MSAPLTTLAAFKQFMSVTDTVVARDALWTTLIDQCSATIENVVQRTLSAADYVEVSDGTSQRVLLTHNWPINSITSLTIDGKAVPASSASSNGYAFDAQRVWIIPYGSYFSRGIGNISLAFNAGYATIPADLVLLVHNAVASVYKSRDWIGVSSKTLAGETVTFKDEMEKPAAKRTLANYLRVTS